MTHITVEGGKGEGILLGSVIYEGSSAFGTAVGIDNVISRGSGVSIGDITT